MGHSRPPTEDLAAVADAHARLLATVATLDDAACQAPSVLPGWSRAEVVTHLARNADSLREVIEARLRGEFVDQYPGGPPARAEAIARGRDRSAADLKADLASAIEWLHDTWSSVPDDAWDLDVRLRPDLHRTVRTLVESRWREVEVHHTDLDLGYEPGQWPAPFAARFLPPSVERINERALAVGADGGSAPSGPPDATWIIWADDLEMAWVVQTAGGAAVVTPLDEEFPDVLVRGPSAQLLAWLLGRRTPAGAGLHVSGESRLAERLPGWFPFA